MQNESALPLRTLSKTHLQVCMSVFSVYISANDRSHTNKRIHFALCTGKRVNKMVPRFLMTYVGNDLVILNYIYIYIYI